MINYIISESDMNQIKERMERTTQAIDDLLKEFEYIPDLSNLPRFKDEEVD